MRPVLAPRACKSRQPAVDGIEEVKGWSPLSLSFTFATPRSEGADLSVSHDGRFAVLILSLQPPGPTYECLGPFLHASAATRTVTQEGTREYPARS
jgi:hypothetical protein